MYCRKCGSNNDDTTQFCINCGDPMQPIASVSTPAPQVPTHLAQAILTTLFCCLPCGIVSIVYASQVNGKLYSGDYHGALEASNKANTWAWIAFGSGLFFLIVRLLIAFSNT